MFFDSVNTFSTTFHEYENRAALFAKPATPIQPKGSFLREHEYQRNPFALPGFSFETREPPPLGLPSDRLANILKERKKTPSEIREIVQAIVNGPQPDTSSPFQYFLWAMSMEMKKPALNYPNDVILKLISDLVIAQPQILEKIPTPSQIRNREVYLENIPPFLLDVQGNLTTKLPPLDEYKLQFEGKDVKQALIGSTYGDKPAVDSKGNRIQVSATADDGKEYEMDVFTFDPSGGKSLPPTFQFIYMNYDVMDDAFLSLVNFDALPQKEAVLLDLFEYVFVPSRRSAPEEIAKPPFRAILQANDSFLGNLLLGMAEDDRWLSLYLNPARPLKNRTQFCKAFFLEAIQYFINQSSKPQFASVYQHFYNAISALNFELPYAELVARLQAMYSDFYHSLRTPRLERELAVSSNTERKHSAVLPSADPVSLVDAFRELKAVMTSLAPAPNEDAKAAERREEKKALEAERFFKWMQGLNYKGLTDQWAISSFTSNWTKDLRELAETKNADVLRTFLLTAVGSEGKEDPRSMSPPQLEGLFVNIRDQPESPAWTAVFSVLKNFNSFTDLKKWFGRDPVAEAADSKMSSQSSSTSSGVFSSIKTPTTMRLPSLSTGQLVSGILPAPAGAPSAPPTPTSRRGSIAGAPAGAPSGSPSAPTRRRGSRKRELEPREAYEYVKSGKMDHDFFRGYAVSALQREWTVSSISRDVHFNLLSEPENVLRYVLVTSGVREEKQIKQTTRTELEMILQNVQYGNNNREEWMKIFYFLYDYDTLNELKADAEADGYKMSSQSSSTNVGGRGRKKARTG